MPVPAAQNRILDPSVGEDLLQPRFGVRHPVEIRVALQVRVVCCRVERLQGSGDPLLDDLDGTLDSHRASQMHASNVADHHHHPIKRSAGAWPSLC